MISHNAEFYEALCPEKWILESGRLTVMGAEWMEEVEKARKKAEKLAKKTLSFDKANAEAKVDALGNVIEEKPVSDDTSNLSDKEKKKEIKNLQKQIKDAKKNGTLTEDEIDVLEERIEALK